MPNKKDFFEYGRQAASTGIPEAPKAGTWQRRAFDEGVAAAHVQSSTRSPDTALREASRVAIDTAALGFVIRHFPAGRAEHIRQLAIDYNAEKQGTRRLRLYKKIGQLFERHGLRAPIPTSI